MFKKILSIALLLCALCACKKTPIDNTIPVDSVSLNQNEAEMLVGETLQLQAQVLPSNATDKSVTWVSTNKSVATVSDEGLVTAVGKGATNISASAGGKNANCVVIVTESGGPVVHVESISLNKETASLEVGGTLALTATVLPENAANKKVLWKSTNPEIAEVDQAGNVTAVSSGTVTITATTSDGGKVAACEVTVTAAFIPVESVTFDLDEYIIYPGDSFTPKVTILPENATDKTITWSSSDANAVSVSQDGIITGHAEALVTITAKAGDKEATCIIHCVHNPDEDDEHDGEENGHYWVDMGLPSGIKWATCNVGADNSSQLGSMFAWGETFARESEDNPPYTLYNSATGKYTKYVTDSWHGNVDNLTTLEAQDDAAHVQWGGDWRMPTAADAMELIENSTYEPIQHNGVWCAKLTSKINGHSIFLRSQLDDEPYGNYMTSSLGDTWSSQILSFDNEKINPYSWLMNRGGILPVRAVIGTTTYIPVERIDYEYSNDWLFVGETRALKAWVVPANATHNTVVWTSSMEDVATVDANGNVTAIGVGDVIIKASAGGRSYSFYFSVYPPLESIKIEPAELTLEIGESAEITVIPTPQNVLKYYSRGYTTKEYNIIDVVCTGGNEYDSNDPLTFRITAKAGGEATFMYYAVTDGGNITGTCHVTVPYIEDDYDGETDGHKWVDLGLPSGIKWATCNVGADYSPQIGPLLAWGEGENDPVKKNWGGGWRMPTLDDVVELHDNTTFEWMDYHGVTGTKLTSKNNGKSIFLAADRPEELYGYYLTSTLDGEDIFGIGFSTDIFGMTWEFKRIALNGVFINGSCDDGIQFSITIVLQSTIQRLQGLLSGLLGWCPQFHLHLGIVHHHHVQTVRFSLSCVLYRSEVGS